MSWRNSKAFQTLQVRMLMLMTIGLTATTAVMLRTMRAGEWGKCCSNHALFLRCSPLLNSPLPKHACFSHYAN